MRLLLLSNSQTQGLGYLEWARESLHAFLADVSTDVLFIPYAAVTKPYDDYIAQIESAFGALDIGVKGLHREANPITAVRGAAAIVVGGGNTWKLLREVRAQGLLSALRDRVMAGIPYVGWSAGSNLACPTIMTTNDMPICDSGGLDALGLIPFQINPHYLHGNPPGFKGETREERIVEFCALQPHIHVTGLREGTGLRIEDARVRLVGSGACRIFRHGEPPRELGTDDDLSFLLAAN